MKQFISFCIIFFIGIQNVFGFQDIKENSKLYPAVQNLIDRGLIKNYGFYRPEHNTPAIMFWEIIIKYSGFDATNINVLGPQLPINITKDNILAPILQEAVRMGFINPNNYFYAHNPITKIQAIKALLTVKNIKILKRSSLQFRRKISGRFRISQNLPILETAYNAGFLSDADLYSFAPDMPLKRRELAEWIYRYDTHNTKKIPINTNNIHYVPYEKNYLDQKEKNEIQKLLERVKFKEVENENGEIETQLTLLPLDSDLEKNFKNSIPNGELFESIYTEINEHYRFPEKLNPIKKKEMINAAISAMVKEIGDKYSSYIEPEDATDFKRNLNGNFDGIGAYVDMIDGKFTITAPIKGSPAEKAGLLAGDIVKKINGVEVLGQSQNEIIDKVRGPRGTKVLLTIIRNKQEQDIEVIRGKITIPSVTVEWKKSVPIVGIHQFNNDTKKQFDEIIKNEILPQHPKGLVLDFRNNPGGFLTVAVEIGEYFLAKGDLIFSMEYKDEIQEYVASRTGELFGFDNIYVLQNKGTASAAEIIISMLQDYGITKVIGTQSLGKGTVQEVSNFSNGGLLKLTIAKWLSPLGRWIHETGITPDIKIEDITPEEKKQGIDKAIDIAVKAILEK